MSKWTRNTGRRWTPADVMEIEELAREMVPSRRIGLALGRTAAAVRAKAKQMRISMRAATTQSISSQKH